MIQFEKNLDHANAKEEEVVEVIQKAKYSNHLFANQGSHFEPTNISIFEKDQIECSNDLRDQNEKHEQET